MVGGGGRIWTDTAPFKRRRARPYLSELGCHGRSLRGATAASQLCTPGGDWRGGPTPLRRSVGEWVYYVAYYGTGLSFRELGFWPTLVSIID